MSAAGKSDEKRAAGVPNPERPLTIVFDIDGTLIRESRHLRGIFPRPHAVELLVWCRQRGHKVALWTAAHWSWANAVTKKICPLVQKALHNQDHTCDGRDCTETFQFVWGGDKMRLERQLEDYDERFRGECLWCEFYSEECDKCECRGDPDECPCRGTKDLRKLWWHQQEIFSPERTLIVENTPQMCRYTYGNAIYVPTYRGRSDDKTFHVLQSYIEEELEDDSIDVTKIKKCDHPPGPHACFHQNWWPSI